jgi:phosphohistidine phosphatase
MTSIQPPPHRIYLLRHGKSGWAEPGQSDFDRMLDAQGFAETEIVATKAADRNYRPDIVISSTAMRCRQTAEAIRRAIDEEMEPLFVDELYNGVLSSYLDILAAQQDSGSAMLIGHNPTMEQVLTALIGEGEMNKALGSGFPTAGLAVLDHAGTGPGGQGAWKLVDFIRP